MARSGVSTPQPKLGPGTSGRSPSASTSMIAVLFSCGTAWSVSGEAAAMPGEATTARAAAARTVVKRFLGMVIPPAEVPTCI
ncbi:hypothetical protein ACFQZ4_04100 [Catellatospora coxensis]